MKTVIIDYDAGNLANVYHALLREGTEAEITRDPETIRKADAMILPGVGAMGDAMAHLRQYGLTELIREEVGRGKKLAGICLGMQALFEVSEEGGQIPCLGFLPGKIEEIPAAPGRKVPHMGWNELEFRAPHWIARGLPPHPYVYFVHSYYKTPSDTADVIASADYGVSIPAVVGNDSVIGLQFHPEKSGPVGAQLWRNILEWFEK
jgi:glutamine amidotransferase